MIKGLLLKYAMASMIAASMVFASSSPSDAAGCNQPARIMKFPSTPATGHGTRTYLTVLSVDIEANGRMHGAKMVRASGNAAADASAIAAAQKSIYQAATKNCLPIESKLMFVWRTGN